MHELTIIEQQTVLGQELRIYGDYETPLFLARDVAKRIGHSNVTSLLQTIQDDEKVKLTLPPKYCLGGIQAPRFMAIPR